MSLEDEEFGPTYQARPIACKLTDFGESRSRFIQTQAIIASKTPNIDRGTVVYMAPELLVKEKLVPCASIDDLILSDVWALGMIVFAMINPSIKCPCILDIRSAGGFSSQEELKKLIISLLATEKLPLQDVKYELDRATAWCDLEKIYRGCAKFDRQQRLTLEEAGRILSRLEGRFSRDIEVSNLKISQATSIEHFDQKVAAELERPCLKPLQMKALPVNDGTTHVPSCLLAWQKESYTNPKLMIFSKLYQIPWSQPFGLCRRKQTITGISKKIMTPWKHMIFFENSTSLSLR